MHCNHCIDIISKELLKMQKQLKEGDNIIEFTPNDEGTYTYTCWMNMIKNNIKVVDDVDYFKEK